MTLKSFSHINCCLIISKNIHSSGKCHLTYSQTVFKVGSWQFCTQLLLVVFEKLNKDSKFVQSAFLFSTCDA